MRPRIDTPSRRIEAVVEYAFIGAIAPTACLVLVIIVLSALSAGR